MTIAQDVLDSNPSPFIELFQLDLSLVGYTQYTETVTPTLNFIAGSTIAENYGREIVVGGPLNTGDEWVQYPTVFAREIDVASVSTHSFPFNNSIVIPASTYANSGRSDGGNPPTSLNGTRLEVIGCNWPSTGYTLNFFVYMEKAHIPTDLVVVICYYDDIVNGSNSGSWELTWNTAGYATNGNSFILRGFNFILEMPFNNPYDQLIGISINWENGTMYMFINGTHVSSSGLPSAKHNGNLFFGMGYADNINTNLYFSFIRGYDHATHTTDFVPTLPTSKLYLTNNTADGQAVQFGGKEYTPWPLMIEGLSATSSGAPARPTLTLGNLDINKSLRKLAYKYNDLIGCELNYIRTFADYLNTQYEISAATLKYIIGRKISHSNKQISFELRSKLDRTKSYLPSRQMLRTEFPGLGTNRNVK
jgi:phage-related protein